MQVNRRRLVAVFAIVAIPVTGITLATTPLYGYSTIRTAWRGFYEPGSDSYTNLPSCTLCHATGGGSNWNAYGWAIREQINGGATNEEAFLAVENLNSDNDPTGSTNIEEIFANTQPGWTGGPNNTYFYGDNTTDVNQNPPALTGGTYDPCPADTDGNSTVDVSDLLAVLGNWGTCPAPCPPNCDQDVVPDCVVDILDLLAILGAWGSCPN